MVGCTSWCWHMLEAYLWYMVYGCYGSYILAHDFMHILMMLGICFEICSWWYWHMSFVSGSSFGDDDVSISVTVTVASWVWLDDDDVSLSMTLSMIGWLSTTMTSWLLVISWLLVQWWHRLIISDSFSDRLSIHLYFREEGRGKEKGL
jgi:hypothetical protein